MDDLTAAESHMNQKSIASQSAHDAATAAATAATEAVEQEASLAESVPLKEAAAKQASDQAAQAEAEMVKVKQVLDGDDNVLVLLETSEGSTRPHVEESRVLPTSQIDAVKAELAKFARHTVRTFGDSWCMGL